MKTTGMKTNIRLLKTIAMIAAVTLFGATGQLHAQEKGSAKGGAGQLMSKPIRTAADLATVQPGDMMVMSCPKCKNVTVRYVEPTFKAMDAKDKAAIRHACPGCDTTVAMEGHGKAKREVLKHVCQKCGSSDAFCCVVRKAGEPTKGMEEKK